VDPTSGTYGGLLSTLKKASPAAGDQLGAAVAVAGDDVIAGAPAASGTNGEVYRFTAASFVTFAAASISENGTATLSGRFHDAGGAVGPDGDVYASGGAAGNNPVLRFDAATGSSLGAFVPSGNQGVTTVDALLFGPDGNLYRADVAGNRVLRYNGSTGAFLGAF